MQRTLKRGKDSLSLFHILRHFQATSPVKFELGVVTIDPQVEGFEPQALEGFFKKFDTRFIIFGILQSI
jgi:tRNA(Ile)-lysidine synthase TilS/MesJ